MILRMNIFDYFKKMEQFKVQNTKTRIDLPSQILKGIYIFQGSCQQHEQQHQYQLEQEQQQSASSLQSHEQHCNIKPLQTHSGLKENKEISKKENQLKKKFHSFVILICQF